MENTTRRSFLKLLAVAGVTAASPKVLQLVADDAPELPNQTLVGMVRELFHNDALGPWTIVRHDIRTADVQIGIDQRLLSNDRQFYSEKDLQAARLNALARLQDELDKRGIDVANLQPLPTPRGYEFNTIRLA